MEKLKAEILKTETLLVALRLRVEFPHPVFASYQDSQVVFRDGRTVLCRQ